MNTGEKRLPIVVVALLLLADIVSAIWFSGVLAALFTILLIVNVGGLAYYFRNDFQRLATAHAHSGVNQDQLKADLMQALPVPFWLAVTLAVGALGFGLALIKFVGFLIGLIFVVAIIVVVVGGGYWGWKTAKKRGLV